MAVIPSLLAFLLAAAQPAAAVPAPGAAADHDAVLALFEGVCLDGKDVPEGFEKAAWADFPEPLRLMNTYDHGGTFFRRAAPATYIARTQGPGHMMPGVETRCGVAAQGIDTARIVERLTKRAETDKAPEISMGGVKATMIFGKGGAFTVTRSDDNWVIVRSMGLMIPADSIPRRYRKKKGG